MPLYQYKVRDSEGRESRGTLDSPSEADVVKVLRESNYFIIDIRTEQPEASAAAKSTPEFFQQKISKADVLILTRQLSAMAASGIPIMNVLKSISEQVKKRRLKDIILSLRSDVEEGQNLSEAMGKHPEAFTPFYTSMVKMGEAAGNLDEILSRIVAIQEKEMDITNKIKAAVTYPAVLLVVALSVMSFLLIFILPKFIGIFQTYETKLPLATTILLQTSLFVKNYWAWIVVAIGGLILWGVEYLKRPEGKRAFDGFLLKLPIVGPLVMKTNVSSFARSVSGLIASGITLIDALSIAEGAMSNTVVKAALANIRISITEGKSFSKTMIDTGLFPPTVIQMVAAGESTGRLDQMLWDLSRFYDSEVDNEIKSMTVLLEPTLLIIMGGMVAFVALSVLLPIFNLIKIFKH